MGFLDDAKKWLKGKWKKSGEIVEDAIESVGEFAEDVGSFVIDGVVWVGEKSIDGIQSASATGREWLKSSSGYIYSGVEGALDSASNGIESAFGPNVVSSMLDKLDDGIEWAGDVQESFYDNVDTVTETVDLGVDSIQSWQKDGINALQDLSKQANEYTEDIIKNAVLLFKNENGIETDESLRDGLAKVARLALNQGKSIEVSLTDGTTLLFNPSKNGCEVYSTDNLSKVIGKTDIDGLFKDDALDNMVDKILGRQDFEKDILNSDLFNKQKEINDITKILQGNNRDTMEDR